MNRNLLILLILAIVLFHLPRSTQHPNLKESSFLVTEDEQIHRHWAVNIVLVNYELSVVNTDIIVENLPVERIYTVDDLTINYTIDYSFVFTNQTYSEQVQFMIENNSVNGSDTGTRINETALEYHREHPENPQRIFYSRSGRSIDAYALEDWLADNPAIKPPDLGYNFYLFNYSQLDSHNHELEHWYDYHDIDPDTGEQIDWFRLEWDNELNPAVTFQYAGFGGRRSLYVLDPSANQWYLRWARIWWGMPPYDSAPEYCTKDLEDKVSEVDLSTQTGIDSLSEYLGRYMTDVIGYIHFPTQHQPAKYANQGDLEAIIFSLDTENGVPVDSVRWVTHAEMQKSHLQEFLPFIDWQVNVNYLDMHNYPDWNETFWSHAETVDGETVVDGLSMFNDIYENHRHKYVDVFSEDINVFGVVFIKKNMVMHAYGREYTGLGGRGQTVIWKSWERYYRPDGVTPREGVSGVQLHETLHAVGFGHTWVQDHYAGDFSYSPMGYFGMHNGTSVFDQNWVQSTYLDQMEWDYYGRFLNISGIVPEDPRPQTVEAKETALACFEEARQLYNSMNWFGCFRALEDADAWTTRLMYSIFDTDAPEFIDWGVEFAEVPTGGGEAWAVVRDDLSGIEKVTVHVIADDETEYQYACEKSNNRWVAQIPPLSFENELIIWIEAVDLAMNTAQTNTIRHYQEESGLLGWLIAHPYISVGTIAIMVVIVSFYRRWSK